MKVNVLTVLIGTCAAGLMSSWLNLVDFVYAQPQSRRTTPSRQTLGALATHRVTLPTGELRDVVAGGLSDATTAIREQTLLAIAGRAGVLMSPTEQNLAVWAKELPVLMEFRDQIRLALRDQDDHVRNAAFLAFVSLLHRRAGSRLIVHLDGDSLSTLEDAYVHESSAYNRGEIVKAVALCPCTPESADRRPLLKQALGDSSSNVVRFAISGAAELRMSDVLDQIVQRLDSGDRIDRSSAATALGRYGTMARAFLPQMRQALLNEHDVEVHQMLEAAINRVSVEQ